MTAPDAPDAMPDGQEAGATSNPRGDGPVSLGDRVSPDSAVSPDTNQGKTEPIAPTPGHGDRSGGPPELGGTTVAGNDPQGVNPAGLPPRGAGPGPGNSAGGAPGPAVGTGVADQPVPGGEASRVPGELGTSPEAIETDVQTSATRVQPGRPPHSTPPAEDAAGDDHGGFLPGSGVAAEGTSETFGVVAGARVPAAPTAPPGPAAD